ncbi:MAG: L-threonylcarbamoyladenylate synthase [Desulfuromonadales bacterium]|nr:L-threonylcarbamoyladenylate synthase [Desulfuromonadales bacterium]MDT8423897.1 L-threonylcarbamoyladenylate synthase [Desulfuromonadales bacterium]
MLVRLNPENPQPRVIKQIVEVVQKGGVIAYPTDTIYGLGCDIFNQKAIKKIYQIKQRDARKPFSFVCADIADVTNYAQVSNFAFKIMKRHLPGPYTFVLRATRTVPELLTTKQKTVGIRIPASPIALNIVRELGHPLVTTSVNLAGSNPIVDPEDIFDELGAMLELVVDGGITHGEPSTIISLLDDCPEVLRVGSGPVDWLENL